MVQRLILSCVLTLATLGAPVAALAQPEPERDIVDARLEGYEQNVTIEGGGVGVTVLIFCLLTVVCIGVLFKDSKRTHLD